MAKYPDGSSLVIVFYTKPVTSFSRKFCPFATLNYVSPSSRYEIYFKSEEADEKIIKRIFVNSFVGAVVRELYGSKVSASDIIDEDVSEYDGEEKNEILRKRLNDSYKMSAQFYTDFAIRHSA